MPYLVAFSLMFYFQLAIHKIVGVILTMSFGGVTLLTYLLAPITEDFAPLRSSLYGLSNTRKLVSTSVLCAIAAILQSAGVIPGIGYLISFLATAPIIMAVFISIGHGIIAYGLTILILFVLQPSELIIFPFTTGLLGIGVGLGFCYLIRRIAVITFAALWLCFGISTVLYLLQFHILGPMVDTSFSLTVIIAIYIFSIFYSWLWVWFSGKWLIKLLYFVKSTMN